jgi:hydrogenobyrinic acid a,c-diamide synthase (glutamine-hydrolysing) / cobyrinate a,c-diamide synthase
MSLAVSHSGSAGSKLPARLAPAVLVSAPASGHGKTTVVAALARRLSRAGLDVRVFKTGPDFLDPAWHELASGHTVHNLDLWMTGEDDIRRRLYDAAGQADLILVEGVMGLYDGEPSAAEMAHRLGLPVLAVIDASSMTGTFGALAHGLRTWLPGLRWAGALANRVASPRHAELLASACQRPGAAAPTRGTCPGSDPKPASIAHRQPDSPSSATALGEGAGSTGEGTRSDYLGSVFRNAAFAMPARHLGLIPASELADARQKLDAAADALEGTVLGSLDRETLQRWNTCFLPPEGPGHTAPTLQPLAGRTIAIARDAAFAFVYPSNLEVLQALGATLTFFSPLADDPLPACDAVWLPGGYPELHAERLSACRRLPETLRAHIEADRPVWAECGGMLPLFEQMRHDERDWPMWGILPGSIEFGKRAAGLGMQQLAWPAVSADADLNAPAADGSHDVPTPSRALDASASDNSASAPTSGETIGPLRGHTFHYSRCITPLPEVAHSSRPVSSGANPHTEAVYRYRQVRASYFHAWFASAPTRAAALFLPKKSTC